eukprot:gene9493-32476_t
MSCEDSTLPQYQLHDLGCIASVEPSLHSYDDPAWLHCLQKDGCRRRPSPRHCQFHSVIPQPPTFSGSVALGQIDCPLIPEYSSAKTVLPGQSRHLRKAHRILPAPLSLLPYTTSVAKGGTRTERVNQDVQPLLIIGLPPGAPEMNLTPIAGEIESIPTVQQYDHAYDPSRLITMALCLHQVQQDQLGDDKSILGFDPFSTARLSPLCAHSMTFVVVPIATEPFVKAKLVAVAAHDRA